MNTNSRGRKCGRKQYHKQNSQHMMRTSHVEFIRNVELSSASVQRNQVVFLSVTYLLCPENVLKNMSGKK